MRLTKKKAIEISIELWEWLTETGESKGDWPGWKKYGEFDLDCPLCEYTKRKSAHEGVRNECEKYCPIISCYKAGFGEWDDAVGSEERKKYAALFLEQLRKL